jgi:hypothetical protein
MQKRLVAASIVVGVCLAVVFGLRPVSAQFRQDRWPAPNADPRLVSIPVTKDQLPTLGLSATPDEQLLARTR